MAGMTSADIVGPTGGLRRVRQAIGEGLRNTITLRARRIAAPISVVLVGIAFGSTYGAITQNVAASVVVSVFAAYGVWLAFASSREAPLHGAFVRVEREYRRLLEEGSA